MLLWAGLVACGGGGEDGGLDSDVHCDRGVVVGRASYSRVYHVDMMGDQLVVTGEADAGMRNVLVVDVARRKLVAEWQWAPAGRIVGPPTSPGLVWAGTEMTYQAIDIATGALGTPVSIARASQVRDVRLFGDETHIVFDRAYVVLDPAGNVLRSPVLATPASSIPTTDWHIITEDGILGAGVWQLDDELRVLRWDFAGNLVGERTYVLSELGEEDPQRLVRYGNTGALTVRSGAGRTLWPIQPDLSLGEAIASPEATGGGSFAPQGGGATYAYTRLDDMDATVTGLHLAPDGTRSTLEVSCTHPYAGPASGGWAPRDAPRPTWVWHVGADVWIHAD